MGVYELRYSILNFNQSLKILTPNYGDKKINITIRLHEEFTISDHWNLFLHGGLWLLDSQVHLFLFSLTLSRVGLAVHFLTCLEQSEAYFY